MGSGPSLAYPARMRRYVLGNVPQALEVVYRLQKIAKLHAGIEITLSRGVASVPVVTGHFPELLDQIRMTVIQNVYKPFHVHSPEQT